MYIRCVLQGIKAHVHTHTNTKEQNEKYNPFNKSVNYIIRFWSFWNLLVLYNQFQNESFTEFSIC